MSQPTSLLGASLGEFLDQIASKTPTPGGGSAVALVACLAVSLARMVLAYSPARADGLDERSLNRLADELNRLGGMLQQLIDEDAQAYREYVTATKEGTAESERAQAALGLATAVPLEVMAAATNLLRLLDEHRASVSPRLLSDWAAAAHLAQAATAAAYDTVMANVRAMRGDSQPSGPYESCQRMLDVADKLSQRVTSFVRLNTST